MNFQVGDYVLDGNGQIARVYEIFHVIDFRPVRGKKKFFEKCRVAMADVSSAGKVSWDLLSRWQRPVEFRPDGGIFYLQ